MSDTQQISADAVNADDATSMSLRIAQLMIEFALRSGRELGSPPLGVAVLNAAGHMVAAAAEDGSPSARLNIAFGKAHGAVSIGVGSRALFERAERQPFYPAAIVSAVPGPFVPSPGGVLVRSSAGLLIGAVGVSGEAPERDESIAASAVIAAGFVAQVGR